MNLNKLSKECHEIAKSHGFWNDTSVIEKLALISCEVSEAIEVDRSGDHSKLGEEISDIIIRTLDLSYSLGIDIEKEIEKKMEKNKGRSYLHGKKY